MNKQKLLNLYTEINLQGLNITTTLIDFAVKSFYLKEILLGHFTIEKEQEMNSIMSLNLKFISRQFVVTGKVFEDNILDSIYE